MASVRYDEASPVGTDEPAVEHIELDRRLTRRVIMPLAVFAASRVIALVAMDTVRRLRPPPLIPFAVFASWWDGAWYHRIERGGYPVHLTHAADGSIQASSHAFLPLYPLVTRAFDRLLPGNEYWAALAVAVLGGALAAVLLREAARVLASDDVADRTVLLFCFFPGTYALSWAYSEGVMLALLAGVLLLLARRAWLPAALLTGLATATRPNALPAALACVLVAWEVRGALIQRLTRVAAAGAIAVSGFVAFNVYLAVHTDSRLAWFRVENGGWEQNRPLQGLRYVFFAHSPQTASGWMRVATVVFVVIAVAAIIVTLWSSLPVWAKVMAAVTLI